MCDLNELNRIILRYYQSIYNCIVTLYFATVRRKISILNLGRMTIVAPIASEWQKNESCP